MNRKRHVFGASFKAKVALAAVRGDKSTAQVAPQYAVHATQVSAWTQQLLDGASEVFADGRSRQAEASAREEDLFEQIGRLKMELERLALEP